MRQLPALSLVRLGEAAFASLMDHFLHRPNQLLLALRGRILASACCPPREAGL